MTNCNLTIELLRYIQNHFYIELQTDSVKSYKPNSLQYNRLFVQLLQRFFVASAQKKRQLDKVVEI